LVVDYKNVTKRALNIFRARTPASVFVQLIYWPRLTQLLAHPFVSIVSCAPYIYPDFCRTMMSSVLSFSPFLNFS